MFKRILRTLSFALVICLAACGRQGISAESLMHTLPDATDNTTEDCMSAPMGSVSDSLLDYAVEAPELVVNPGVGVSCHARIADHGNNIDSDDPAVLSMLDSYMSEIIRSNDLKTNLSLSYEMMYKTSLEGYMITLSYSSYPDANILISDWYSYIGRSDGVYLLPSSTADRIVRSLVELGVLPVENSPSGVGDAVELKIKQYGSQHMSDVVFDFLTVKKRN